MNILGNALAKLIEEDMKDRDKKIYNMNRDTYKNIIYNLYDKAEEKFEKTLKSKYEEAMYDLHQVIEEMHAGLDNDTLKRIIDEYKRLK